MAEPARRTWRASAASLVLVGLFVLVCLLGLPGLAWFSWNIRHQPAVPVLLLVLAVAGLLYAWRFGVHPRLVADDDQLIVRNPFRTHRLGWDQISLVLPGGNGLVIAGPEATIEAWCVQKSSRAQSTGRRTRADRVADEIWSHWERQHPPESVELDDGSVTIRRARPGEETVLAELEQTASLEALQHVFAAERHPFPIGMVTDRWRDVLRDPALQTFLAVIRDRSTDGQPVGFVAHNAGTVLHLGVDPAHQRRGIGRHLLACAETEIFADPFLAEASLWVLVDNARARDFYRDHGWYDSDHRRRSPYPPGPPELRMTKINPRAARRRRSLDR